jgi:Sigma-70, region 4
LAGWTWFLLNEGGKAIELCGPEALVVVEPVHRLLHRRRGQPARHCAAGLAPRDQAGIGQHVEVLHDRRQRHRKRPGMIDLVYYHQKSTQEVADIVGIPVNTVKTRVHYARKRLSALLQAAGIAGVAA